MTLTTLGKLFLAVLLVNAALTVAGAPLWISVAAGAVAGFVAAGGARP